MLTFADLLSLMLTFFILLYAMSQLPLKEWEPVATSLSQRLNPGFSNEEANLTAPKSIDKQESTPGNNLRYLYNLLEHKQQQQPLLHSVSLTLTDDAITFSLPVATLFTAGENALLPTAPATLNALGTLLASLHNQLQVSVDGPAASPSNPLKWRNSIEKATMVAESLKKAGYPYNIEAFGQMSTDKDQRVRLIIRDFGVSYP